VTAAAPIICQLITVTNTMFAIEKTKEIANYMRSLYTAEIEVGGEAVPFPNWPIDVLQECQFAAKVIAQAVRNDSKLSPLNVKCCR
jgi:hypothetical protein